MISKNNLPKHFLLLSKCGHPAKLLSNVIVILFKISQKFKIEYQMGNNEQVRHFYVFAFNEDYKTAKAAREISAV